MAEIAVKKPIKKGASLDTLANHWNKKCKSNLASTLENLKKRAQAKHLTNKYVIPLMELHSPMEKAYRNTYYCNQVLEQEGKKIIGKYCGNRWCVECNRIRTAKLISGYKPAIEKWKSPSYMVLTVKNIKAEKLRDKILEMNAIFRKLTDLVRKRDQLYIEAIRTIEVTYNRFTNEYHPHFNIVANEKLIAEMILAEWLQYFPDDQVNRGGQFITAADQGTLNELFKYVTKFDGETPAPALDVIFQALKGIKITSPTHIKRVSEDIEDLIGTNIPELEEANRLFMWNQKKKDWIAFHCWPEPEGIGLCQIIEKIIKTRSP